MADIDRKRIFEKVRKCLALSKSANEHEAAAALRHARALMDKHGLTISDDEIFRMRDTIRESKHVRHPRWAVQLAGAVGRAFSCSVYTGYRKVIFVGQESCSEVAGYSFDILLRQLEGARKAFLGDPRLKYADRAAKKKLGQAFAEGWVEGVWKVVQQFAAALTDERQAKHTEYMKGVTDFEIQPGKEKASAIRPGDGSLWAARHGFEQGGQVKLHQGVAAGEQPSLLEGA